MSVYCHLLSVHLRILQISRNLVENHSFLAGLSLFLAKIGWGLCYNDFHYPNLPFIWTHSHHSRTKGCRSLRMDNIGNMHDTWHCHSHIATHDRQCSMLISFINTKKGGFVNVYRSTTYIVQFTQCSFATLSTLQYLKISATQQQVNNNSLSLLGTNKSGIDIVKMPMAAPSNRHLSKKKKLETWNTPKITKGDFTFIIMVSGVHTCAMLDHA